MIKFITNKEINLSQLDKELGGFGLCCDSNDLNNKIISVADGSNVSLKQLEDAIKKHVAQPTPELTIEEKLQSVGLSLEDLKKALGI